MCYLTDLMRYKICLKSSKTGQVNCRLIAEVSLIIKSEKPISIDKVKSDKNTNIKLDTGNMILSY